MSDLKLDYLSEARAVLGEYIEDSPDTQRPVIESIAYSLLSIAESLHRIVEEEVPSGE